MSHLSRAIARLVRNGAMTIGLDNRIPEYEGRNLAEEFRQYLPGLLKRVLEIPRQRVTDLIKHTDKNVPALARKKWVAVN
jgi:hypothetical protein